MSIFEFFFASDFKIKMKKFKKTLFQKWTCEYKNDGYEEVFIFHKNGYTLKFAEDLREHSVLLTINYNGQKIFSAGYKEITLASPDLNCEDIKITLPRTTTDLEEVDAYFQFLQLNKIV